MSGSQIKAWHENQLVSIQEKHQSENLIPLCNTVYNRLESSACKIKLLQDNFSGSSCPPNLWTRRTLALQALHDAIEVFEAFSIVSTDKTLEATENIYVVREYLKMIFKLAITLGRLLDRPGGHYETWFQSFESVSKQLHTFWFDNLERDFLGTQIDDPNLSGVIVDPSNILATYLPAVYPTALRFVRNETPYGPRIMEN
ncbi:hypothetical protein G7Y89_g5622 [Cudoniella acicularis]|uniref:Uncharacterized protein n=1 Tax=Cudoniella acicularis TaxID=354080 RepID=A0A8H4W3T6_9HELO|nr:hypothetical protein G7Y89_g5622 [Cudoniella acicularis]